MSGCEPFSKHCEQFARGSLEGEARAAFEAHLSAGCPACSRAAREAQAVPPSRLAARTGERSRWMIVLAGATAGVALVWGWQLHREARELAKLRAQVQGAMSEQRELADRAKQVLLEQQAAMILSDSSTAAVVLQPQKLGLPVAHAYWNPRLGIFLTAVNVRLESNRTLQLWLAPQPTGEEPVSKGLFQPDATGRVVLIAPGTTAGKPPLATIEISEEPTGGSARPTQVLWLGKLK
jgi:hypothetical protein